MAGDPQQRFCPSCRRIVHDLSALTRNQAHRLLDASPHGLCARMATNARGDVVFRPESPSPLARFAQIALLGATLSAARGSVAGPQARACPVEVRVRDEANQPIPGANVSFARAGHPNPAREGATDTAGRFAGDLPPGRYRLRVNGPNFIPYYTDVRLSCDRSSPARFDVPLRFGIVMGEMVELRPQSANPFVRAWDRSRALWWRLRHSI